MGRKRGFSQLGRLGAVLWIGLGASGAFGATEGPSTGFYPIWETPASTDPQGQIRIGTSSAHFAPTSRLQVGLQPLPLLYRVPNAQVKWRVWDRSFASDTDEKRPGFELSLQLAGYALLPGAGNDFVSPMYTGRLDNADATLWVIPATLATTTEYGSFRLHLSATALAIAANIRGAFFNEWVPGASAVLEWQGSLKHSVALHGMRVGGLTPDFWVSGVSYRYQGSLIEFRAGYFYRFHANGIQRAPLLSLGVRL